MPNKINVLDIARQAVDIEIQGLQSLITHSLDETFEKAIDYILEIKGRVIVSGMGKSGHVARKIAATFSSTGTPALFVHPGEASHGDLGMITSDDVVIYLSESGNTREMEDILHHCKRHGIKVIGLSRVKESKLIHYADVPIVLERIPECNSLNAPSTSTTMMMAYGDALATTLLTIKRFDEKNFSHLHPGGKLGATFIKVRDIMRPLAEIPTCSLDDNIITIANFITQKVIGCTAVIDANNFVLGIITEGDILRNLNAITPQTTVKELANIHPIAINEDDLASEAVHIMSTSGRKGINVILVVDHKDEIKNQRAQLKGMLHIQDCIKANIV